MEEIKNTNITTDLNECGQTDGEETMTFGNASFTECDSTDEAMTSAETDDSIDPRDSIITDENIKEFQMLNLLSKKKDVTAMIETVKKEQKKFITDGELSDHIDEFLERTELEDIQNLTDDEIRELFTIGDEEKKLNITVADETKDIEFRRDFLVFMKQSTESMKEFDLELEKLEKEIALNQEEFDKAVASFGNMNNLIRAKLEERYNSEEDEHRRELFGDMIAAFDNGMNLDNVKEYYSSYKARKVLGDYVDDKKSRYIYRRYTRVLAAHKISFDLTKFANLERLHLPEEYQKHPNIFIFSVISMVSTWDTKNLDRTKGLFLTQFNTNIQNLYYNKFDNIEDKTEFLKNIMEVIKLIDR